MENKPKYNALVKTNGKKEVFQMQCCSIRCHCNYKKQYLLKDLQ